jgi:hypothetical protein
MCVPNFIVIALPLEKNRLQLRHQTRIELENPLHGFSHIFGSHRREADLCFIRFADEFRDL